jgi:hypothetical protein
VKEKRTFRRFDLFSALAVCGVLMVLLFESFFIFELYEAKLFRKDVLPVDESPLPASQELDPGAPGDVVPVG